MPTVTYREKSNYPVQISWGNSLRCLEIESARSLKDQLNILFSELDASQSSDTDGSEPCTINHESLKSHGYDHCGKCKCSLR